MKELTKLIKSFEQRNNMSIFVSVFGDGSARVSEFWNDTPLKSLHTLRGLFNYLKNTTFKKGKSGRCISPVVEMKPPHQPASQNEKKMFCQACSNEKHGVKTRKRIDHTCERGYFVKKRMDSIQNPKPLEKPPLACPMTAYGKGKECQYPICLCEWEL